MSEERRRMSDDLHNDVKEISKSVTEISTMLAINFHPETGHVTKRLTSLETKVDDHGKFVGEARTAIKWSARIIPPALAALWGAFKLKVIGGSN